MMSNETHHRLYRSIRSHFVTAASAERVDIRGKKMIVTGATPGSLGFETALALASWGASVVVTTRSNTNATVESLRTRLEDGSQGSVDGHPIDLSDRGSVQRFERWYRETHGDRLDVLVNNAGIHLDLLSKWKEPHLSEDGFEIQWHVNYLGTAQLTHLLLPLLRRTGEATGDARVVNVVSHLHFKGSNDELFKSTEPYNSWKAYGRSKLALVHMTLELQRRFAESSHLQAYCLHPGSVFTNVADRGLTGTGIIEAVRNALSPIEAFFLKTPEEGAQTQIYCATHPGLAGGLYYKECQPAKPSQDSQDAEISARLWSETEAWLSPEKMRPQQPVPW